MSAQLGASASLGIYLGIAGWYEGYACTAGRGVIGGAISNCLIGVYLLDAQFETNAPLPPAVTGCTYGLWAGDGTVFHISSFFLTGCGTGVISTVASFVGVHFCTVDSCTVALAASEYGLITGESTVTLTNNGTNCNPAAGVQGNAYGYINPGT